MNAKLSRVCTLIATGFVFLSFAGEASLFAGNLLSDDFNPLTAEPNPAWRFYDPYDTTVANDVGQSTLTYNGASAFISIPAGVTHDLWASPYNKAPRLLQAADNTDFSIQAKFESTVSQKYQMQGIIVQQTNDIFIRFDTIYDGISPHVFIAYMNSPMYTIFKNEALPSTPAYAQVIRKGNQWTYRYSNDGLTWIDVVTFVQAMTVTEVGFFAGTHDPAPAFLSSVDYFMNLASPIFDSDGPSLFPPQVDVWYGNTKTAGLPGNPQQWVNILGRASSPAGIASLTYSLNGGPDQALRMGPEIADVPHTIGRLAGSGDFNIEINRADLMNRANTVEIKALDTTGVSAVKTVAIQHAAGNTWPLPYIADWGSLNDIQDVGSVAQMVDGIWYLTPEGIRTAQIGYDRTIAIGDMVWLTDYEVTVPIKLHSSFGGIGFAIGWQGHEGTQSPRMEWPVQSLAWLRGPIGTSSLDIVTYGGLTAWETVNATKPVATTLNKTYMLKAHSESLGGGMSRVQLKFWPQSSSEPAVWDVSADVATRSGSVLLIAYQADVTFGNVSIASNSDPLPPYITAQPTNQTVVAGQAATFTVAATGSGTLSYQWKRDGADISGATGASYTTAATILGDNGAVYTCAVGNNGGSVISNPATLTVTNPATSLLVNPGFETGVAPWFFYTNGAGTFDNNALGKASPHAGHIAITQSGSNTQLYQAGIALEANTLYRLSFNAYSNTGHDVAVSLVKHVSPYTNYGLANFLCNLTTAWGVCSVQFATAGFTGTVNDGRLMIWLATYATAGDQYFFDDVVLEKVAPETPPTIVTQPSNQSVTEGQTATFKVAASGSAPLSYQWKRNGVNIAGAIGASYTTPATSLVDNGATFTCIVANNKGSVASNAAALTVTPIPPPTITTQPADRSVMEEQAATFSVAASGIGTLSYQWKRDGADIAGATGASYTTPATTIADNGSVFTCVVTNKGGSVASNAATLTVTPIPPPTIITQPADRSVMEEQAATFSVAASGIGTLSYQWKRDGADIAGAIGASYTTPATSLADNGAVFTCIVANKGGSVASNAAALTVTPIPPPAITTQPADRSVMEEQAATFSVAASGIGTLSYQWKRNGADIAGATGATYAIPITALIDNGAVFTCIVANKGGSVASNAATLTVTPIPPPTIITQPADRLVMEEQAATFSVTASGIGTLSYQWKRDGADIAGATGATYAIPIAALIDNGAVFTCIVANKGGSVASNAATLTVTPIPPPSITSQPADRSVMEEQAATFSVAASGIGTLSYQWKRDGADIAGATGATYAIPIAALIDNGAVFTCIVANKGGSVASNAATLTVTPIPPPTIITQPADRSVMEEQAATFSVAASGIGTLSYQWKRDGADIAGATGATYAIPIAALIDNGAVFACIIANKGGSVASNAATLTVTPIPPPTIITQPADRSVMEEQAAAFSIAASGIGTLSYQWKRDGADIAGATGATYAIPIAALIDNGAVFACIVANKGGSVASNAATLTVTPIPPPTITSQPADRSVMEEQAATFSVAASGIGTLSYQWKRDGADIAGATGATYAIPITALIDNGAVFTCIVANKGGSVASNAATLTVTPIPPPSITSQPADRSVMEEQAATFSVAASGIGTLSYQWKRNGADIAGATGATYAIPITALIDNGAVFTCIVANKGGSVASNAATLTVTPIPPPTIITQPADRLVMEEQAATFSVAASGIGTLSYQWKRNGADIAGATGATYAIPIAALIDNGAVFTCIVANKGGSVASNAATLTVTPIPPPTIITQPADRLVMEEQAATFSVAASGIGTLSYQWKRNGADIAGATGATYAIPITALIDNGAVFACIVANKRGSVASNAATLTVTPIPPPTIITQPAYQSVKEGQTATFSIAASGGGTLLYQWRRNGTNVWGATGASYTTPATSLADNGAIFTCIVVNKRGSVVSNAVALTVTPVPPPIITAQPANRSVIEGQTATFSVAASGSGTISYQWRRDGISISGATGASYATPATTLADNGAIFSCLVANEGLSILSSNPATLTVSAIPLLSNPGFESGVSPWLFYASSTASFYNDRLGNGTPHSGHVTMGKAGSNIQLYQAGLALQANTSYLLSFSAYSNTGHDVEVSVVKNGFPYGSYGLSNYYCNLTASWTGCSVQFTTSSLAGNDGRLMFGFGPYAAAGDEYFFDDVLLVKTTPPTAPVILTHPSNQTVAPGQTATFSIAARGVAPLFYQWKRNGEIIPGATSAAYTTPATVVADNHSYFVCIVNNSVGASVSNPAVLTVDSPPVFDYTLANSGRITIAQGGTGKSTISAELAAEITELVSLAAHADLAGMQFVWQDGDSCFPNCSRVLAMAAPEDALPGDYTVVVEGAPLNRITGIPLTVVKKGSFVYSLSTIESMPIAVGKSENIAVVVHLDSGQPEPVSLAASGGPPGTVFSWPSGRTCTAPCSVDLKIDIPVNAELGTYSVSVAGNPQNNEIRFNVIVQIAAISFQHLIVDENNPRDPHGKAAGDLNGDGLMELVVGSSNLDGIWYYQAPDWIKKPIVPSGSYSTDLELGDVDGDGDLDVIAAKGSNGGSIVWFRNPDWTESFIGSARGHDVEVRDLDNDGRLDVITRGQSGFSGLNGNEIIFFRQEKNGGWTRQVVATPHGEGLKVADVNNDGWPDFVIAGCFYQNPGGDIVTSLWREVVYDPLLPPTSKGFIFDYKIETGDISGDGWPDFVYVPAEDHGPMAWVDGLTRERHFIEPEDVTHHHSLRVADVNNDNRMDVITAEMHQSPNEDEVVVLFNLGKGLAWQKQILSINGSHNLVASDFDNDGDIDIFGANWSEVASNSAVVEMWENLLDPPDNWQYIQADNSREAFSSITRFFGLAFGDIDKDGSVDIVSGKYWYRNPGGDMTGPWNRVTFPLNVDAMLETDVDGDEFPDIIAESLPDLYWLEAADKKGLAWSSVKIGSIPATIHVNGQGYTLAQLTPSERPEIVLSAADGIYYFEIPADPSSTWPMVHVSANASEEGIGVGDVDGDGKTDLLVNGAGSNDKEIYWLRNPGEGGWSEHYIGRTGESPDRKKLADINGDGRLDAIVTEETLLNGASVYWFEQPADPFSPWIRHTLVTQYTTNSLDVADMDNDGDVDILTGEHRGSKKVSIWENDGTGKFTEHVVDQGKESHLGTQAIDLDNDGDKDIVSIAWDAYKYLHVWRNKAR